MCSNTCFRFFYSLMIHSYLLISTNVCAGHWISEFRYTKQPNISNNANESNFSEQLLENNSIDSTESDISFWSTHDLNDTTEVHSELLMDTLETVTEKNNSEFEVLKEITKENAVSPTTKPFESTIAEQISDENKGHEVLSSAAQIFDSTINEKIVLERNNCHLEIAIQKSYDLRIQIKFGKLENNTSGRCCIILNGEEHSMLGVLISNIHLYQSAFQGEILKVIISNYGSDFVLKEYHSMNKYQPLLLTETHKVYLVLYYEVTNVPSDEQNSHFNLEVFNYHKYENYFNQKNNFFGSDNVKNLFNRAIIF